MYQDFEQARVFSCSCWQRSEAISASLLGWLGRNWEGDIPEPVCLNPLGTFVRCTGLGRAGHVVMETKDSSLGPKQMFGKGPIEVFLDNNIRSVFAG